MLLDPEKPSQHPCNLSCVRAVKLPTIFECSQPHGMASNHNSCSVMFTFFEAWSLLFYSATNSSSSRMDP